jgi:hypothetical protein
MRRYVIVVAALLASLAVAVAGWLFIASRGLRTNALPCRVDVGETSYPLDREQAANANIVAGAAGALGLPHHAVTVAIAASLQESRLHNLAHGDRDSLGLFQQRPSQGWGTPSQILNPRSAADSFFRRLAQIPNWQTMPVNDAAQRVQHSATPTAYTQWEPEARAIARATTGELPGALTCRS